MKRYPPASVKPPDHPLGVENCSARGRRAHPFWFPVGIVVIVLLAASLVGVIIVTVIALRTGASPG